MINKMAPETASWSRKNARLKHPDTSSPEYRVPLQAAVTAAAEALRAKDYSTFDREIAEAAKIAPQDGNVLHLRGLALFERKNPRKAFPLVREAARQHPRDPAIRHNLAAIQISLGRFRDAEAGLRAVLELAPDYTEAFHTLAPIITFKAGDPLVARMERLAQQKRFSPRDASFLCFALAKAYDDMGATDKAWAMLEQGNAQMSPDYDMDSEDRELAQIRSTYTSSFIATKSRCGHPSLAPLFVVGMPRSGTTLLERLLADHPQVFAAGELTTVPAIGALMTQRMETLPVRRGYADALAAAPPHELFAAGQGYLDTARADATGWFDVFVDKMPDNSFNIGLIRCLLPNARFLHIMRHPLDTMLSIWFQRFNSVPYAFSLAHIAHHYRNYLSVMDHWRTALPGQILEVRYENLVRDPAAAQRHLFRRLHLAGNIAHMRTGSDPRPQSTASRWQVRQPVYTTSREKWRRYAAHLDPLIDDLGGQEVLDREIADQDARCAIRSFGSR
jgi:tetratricopeptide (TPR) repeat protein